MAFWQRRSNRRVFVYTMENGRQKALSRSVTRHLDTEPDHNVEVWVRDWAERNEKRDRAAVPAAPPALRRRLDAYLKYLRVHRRRDPKTISDHSSAIDHIIIPYFVWHRALTDPNHWPSASVKLAEWARETGVSASRLSKANSTLRALWEYLTDEQVVLSGSTLRLRPVIRDEDDEDESTPLEVFITPDEALAEAARIHDRRLRLMLLLGYFFGLRPQEVFGLRRSDFLGGSAAAKLECCGVMRRFGLYDRFAVHVQRQRTQKGKLPDPKSHSKGWVACFDERAAREIRDLIIDADPDKLLFADHGNDWFFKLWKRHGYGSEYVEEFVGNGKKRTRMSEKSKSATATPKDLRRASLYWLGHHTEIGIVELRSHARHKKVDTTLQYLRRPEEVIAAVENPLDLDA